MDEDVDDAIGVDGFVAAITELFWGGDWSEVQDLVRLTWTDAHPERPWAGVAVRVEAGWKLSHVHRTGETRGT